jgi:putative addiction module killer protein
MQKWSIEYWSAATGRCVIEKWLDRLTDEQLRSISRELKMLEAAGNNLRLPHSKSLGNGLFELRERRFGYRIYYCFRDNRVIILLAVGDKKSQENDIKIAHERLLKI